MKAMTRSNPSQRGWLAGCAGLALAALAGAALPSYYASLLIDGFAFAIFAMSLNLLMGYAGLASLGHAAYFAAGAYAAGLVSLHLSQDFWVGMLAGIAAGAFTGAFFGLLALRTTGVYFLMITLALAQIAWAVAFTWRSVTGGDDGLRSIKRPDLGVPGLDLTSNSAYFVLALATCAAAALLMRALTRSPFGRTLAGIRESAARMDALGYNVWLYKYLAFILSAGFAAAAGVLFVYAKGFVSPEAASITVSAEALLMVILGGAATLSGPIVGAFAIILLSNIASSYSTHWTLLLGILYIVVVIVAPQGIVGAITASSTRARGAQP
ncbi:branched-chain amino acid transport system permease protein [Rhizobiales bacterium GAS188]|nr:branched-chain amino acid transport system permease protein [Rhizobiales bacterium GAS188]